MGTPDSWYNVGMSDEEYKTKYGNKRTKARVKSRKEPMRSGKELPEYSMSNSIRNSAKGSMRGPYADDTSKPIRKETKDALMEAFRNKKR